MDFAITHSKEMEGFREEVRAWLKENVPDSMRQPIEGADYTLEMHTFWKGKHKELAAKGWLFPTYPEEYGGGGLTTDHDSILKEEFHEARVVGFHADGTSLATLMVWGSEEQKQKFLVPVLRGEKTIHQKLTEPQSGSDQANIKVRAVKDGDDWLITGENVFISTFQDVDMLTGQALTDPDAPRHRNTGYFIIDNPSPGMQMVPQNLLDTRRDPVAGGLGFQKVVHMENVRVPADHLLGGETQGWQLMGTVMEAEHGGEGRAVPRDQAAENLVKYAGEATRNGTSIGNDPVIQQAIASAVVDAHINTLFQKRVYWMYQSRIGMSYESNVGNVFNRIKDVAQSGRARDVMGMYAHLNGKDPLAPHDGFQDIYQRNMAGQRHAGGSTNIAKVILARRIGISRTQERAAPTPSTATKSAK